MFSDSIIICVSLLRKTKQEHDSWGGYLSLSFFYLRLIDPIIFLSEKCLILPEFKTIQKYTHLISPKSGSSFLEVVFRRKKSKCLGLKCHLKLIREAFIKLIGNISS